MANKLIWAAKRGDLIALKRAISTSVNIDCVDEQGWTPLFHAAAKGHTAAIKLLIKAGANVNFGEKTGFTALFAAVLGQHVAAVRVLLDAGAIICPVQGVELKGCAMSADSKKRSKLLELLTPNQTNAVRA